MPIIKYIFWLLTATLAGLGAGVGIWRYSLSAPLYYSYDGTTLWDKEMVLKEKRSFWPYKTVYGIYWEAIVVICPGDRIKIDKMRARIYLWNGYGILELSVLGKNTGKFIYNKKGIGKKYINITIYIPPQENSLNIKVKDILGNVTEDNIVVKRLEDAQNENRGMLIPILLFLLPRFPRLF